MDQTSACQSQTPRPPSSSQPDNIIWHTRSVNRRQPATRSVTSHRKDPLSVSDESAESKTSSIELIFPHVYIYNWLSGDESEEKKNRMNNLP